MAHHEIQEIEQQHDCYPDPDGAPCGYVDETHVLTRIYCPATGDTEETWVTFDRADYEDRWALAHDILHCGMCGQADTQFVITTEPVAA